MSEKDKRVERMIALGLSDFQTVEDVEERQRALLTRLAKTSIKARRYSHLKDCGPDHCGGETCTEVCRFARWNFKRHAVNAAHALFKNVEGPLYEVRVSRGIWARPFGKLQTVSMPAAKKLSQRAFDSLNDPGIVAVGSVKVAPTYDDPEGWICEIHQIVAGAERTAFEGGYNKHQYITRRLEVSHENVLWAKEIQNLAQTLSGVFDCRFGTWRNPCVPGEVPPANKEQRTEYYDWALDLRPGERVIRYGCDRYFNRLEKEHRPVRIKARKKHPNPWWLQQYEYGEHDPDCRCNICAHRNGGNGIARPTVSPYSVNLRGHDKAYIER